MTRIKHCLCCFIALGFIPVSWGQTYRLAELNTRQIAALNRNKTAVLVPGGILEEHGPYLPSFTDGFADDEYTSRLSEAISSRPGWAALVLPNIPLGFGGANNMGERWAFPGTYAVRFSTLRALYMDLADDFGEQGFRWILLVHDHGDPAHSWALEQASDYFRDTYHGVMIHLFGLKEVVDCYDRTAELLTPDGRKQDGFTVHAGAEETSEMLALRPLLVAADYQSAPPVTGENFQDLYRLAHESKRPGYFGAPGQAMASLGISILDSCSQKVNQIALRILDGSDARMLPRFNDKLDPRDAAGVETEMKHDRAMGNKHREWLNKKGLP